MKKYETPEFQMIYFEMDEAIQGSEDPNDQGNESQIDNSFGNLFD